MTALATKKQAPAPTSETISSEEMGSLLRLMGASALREGLTFLARRLGRDAVVRMIARRPDGLTARVLSRTVDVGQAPPMAVAPPPALAAPAPAPSPPVPDASSKFLDEKQLCNELGISPVTATKWRAKAEGPPFIRVGRLIRYARSAVEGWLAQRTVGEP